MTIGELVLTKEQMWAIEAMCNYAAKIVESGKSECEGIEFCDVCQAEKVLRDLLANPPRHASNVLSPEGAAKVLDMIENPGEPSERLRAAMASLREREQQEPDKAVVAERVRMAEALVLSPPTRSAFTSGEIEKIANVIGIRHEVEAAWERAPHGEGCECDVCLPEYA